MASDLTFTGERFLPDCRGEIAYEHWHRYAFVRCFDVGGRVLHAGTRTLPACPEAVARRASGTLVNGRRE